MKTQNNSADQPVSKKSQPGTGKQAAIHIKEDLISLYSDCLTGLGIFGDKSNYIEEDPRVPLKKTPWRPVAINEQAAFKQKLSERQVAGIIMAVDYAMLCISGFVIVNKKQLDMNGKSQLCTYLDHPT